MDKRDRQPPDYMTELKEGPEFLTADSAMASPMALLPADDGSDASLGNASLPMVSVDLDTVLDDHNETGVAASVSAVTRRTPYSALIAFMLENESQIYWLCASALLVVLGIWFHNIHGRFEFSSPVVSICLLLVSFLSPLYCLVVLFLKPNKLEGPLLSLCAFIGLLFWNQVVAVSCLMVMPFRFKGSSRALGVASLSGLQIGAIFLYPLFAGPIELKDQLKYGAHDLQLCQIKMALDHRVTLTLQEDVPVGPFLTFSKVHWRMVDTRTPKSLAILPIDDTHVAILINRFSHYHRSVVDLTVKNLPIKFEKIEGEY